jgi:mRNA interferase MazF
MATVSKHWVPDRRDMIWVNFNPQVGSEMKDEHPMLVLSPKAFNERTRLVIGLPMTHAQSNHDNDRVMTQKGATSNCKAYLVHRLRQARV